MASNAAQLDRGNRQRDAAAREARGAEGWNWNAVLPYFKKVERDMDFDGPWHGKDGRIPVRRVFPDLWIGHAKAIAEAFDEAGFEYLQDQASRFVADSLLEGSGFELPVPREIALWSKSGLALHLGSLALLVLGATSSPWPTRLTPRGSSGDGECW